MGFAEGFSSGYGLMDATLKSKREEALKQDELAAKNAQAASTLDMENRKLGLAEVTQADTKQHRADVMGYYKDNLAGNLAEKQATLGYRTQESKERAAHDAASLGIQQTNADTNASQARASETRNAALSKQNDSEIKIKEAEAESAAKAQTKLEAGQYAQANWMNSDGTLDGKAIAADPVNATKYLGDLGVDMNHLGKNPELYHNAVQTLQNTFQGYDGKAPMDEATNPEAMDAFNTIFKGQLGTNIGKDVAGKGKIISTKATDILSHQGTPTQDNPSGMLYSIGLVNIYRGKDGKEHQDQTAAPLTQLRSNDNPDDPARGFTASQLHEALQGNAALIDGLISDPNVMGRWGNVVKRNLPKAEKGDKPDIKIEKTTSPEGKDTLHTFVNGVNTANTTDNSLSAEQKAELAQLNATKPQPVQQAQPEIQAPSASGMDAVKTYSREDAIKKQKQNHLNNMKNKALGIRRFVLTPEEIAAQDRASQLARKK
ncbi:MAG: hypothetical protein WCO84_06610 [bacterium]